MTKYRYKNTAKQELVLVGVGVVAAEEIIESDALLENPNLELVPDTKKVTTKKEDSDD